MDGIVLMDVIDHASGQKRLRFTVSFDGRDKPRQFDVVVTMQGVTVTNREALIIFPVNKNEVRVDCI